LKKNLIINFDKLTNLQTDILIRYFNKQKIEILKMLVNLRDKQNCSFEEIKTNLDNINRKLRQNKELLDNKDKDKELFILLEQL
jgi:DNA-binding transcriptional MerR regulator